MGTYIYYVLPSLALLINLLLLILAIRRKPRARVHRAFLFFIGSMALWALTILGMRSSPSLAIATIWERGVLMVFPCIAISYAHFIFLFTGEARPRWLLPSLYGLFGVLLALAPTPLILQEMQLRPYGWAPVGGPLFFPWTSIQMGYILLGLLFLRRFYYRSHRPEERNRALYIAAGTLFALLGTTSDWLAALGLLPYPGGVLGNTLFGIFISLAILRHQLLDIKVVIRKGAIYTAFSVAVAAIYLWLFLLIDRLVAPRAASLTVELLLLFALAVVIHPALRLLERLTDRLLYGQRYGYLQALRQFSAEATAISDLKGLVRSLMRTIGLAMQTNRAWLLLPQEGPGNLVSALETDVQHPSPRLRADSPITQWLQRHEGYLRLRDLEILSPLQALSALEREELEGAEAELFIPLKHQGELVGILVLGPKQSRDAYSLEDVELLFTVAHQAVIGLENARLYALERNRVEQLQELDRLKTDFLATVSHQLKTPITSIKAATGLLADQESADPRSAQGRLLASILKGADALERLVSDLLDFAKAKSARLQLELAVMDMREVVQETAGVVAPAIKAKGQHLIFEIPHHSLFIKGDQQRLEQVLMNLLTNAHKYSPQGGQITLRVRQQDGQVVVEVQDSCGGIPPEDLPWIFQAYTRPQVLSRIEANSSSGLGLAIAKSLVEIHGGKIWVESPVGAGCKFCFSLPARTQ